MKRAAGARLACRSPRGPVAADVSRASQPLDVALRDPIQLVALEARPGRPRAPRRGGRARTAPCPAGCRHRRRRPARPAAIRLDGRLPLAAGSLRHRDLRQLAALADVGVRIPERSWARVSPAKSWSGEVAGGERCRSGRRSGRGRQFVSPAARGVNANVGAGNPRRDATSADVQEEPPQPMAANEPYSRTTDAPGRPTPGHRPRRSTTWKVSATRAAPTSRGSSSRSMAVATWRHDQQVQRRVADGRRRPARRGPRRPGGTGTQTRTQQQDQPEQPRLGRASCRRCRPWPRTRCHRPGSRSTRAGPVAIMSGPWRSMHSDPEQERQPTESAADRCRAAADGRTA